MKTRAWPALATVLAVAACGHSATPAAGTASNGAAGSAASCHQQYETWKHGTASSEIASLKAAFRALQAAGQAQDMLKLKAALVNAGHAASRLSATPPPRCADPKGYYGQLFARVTAAADNAKAAGGLGGLLLAAGTLKTVPAIEKKLNAELNRTVGVKR